MEEKCIPKAKTPERNQWSGSREFFLACLGYCVGLGNIWRFPYLCYLNGGGAFLIAYILVAAFVGMPMYFLEIAMGQFTSSGPINAFNLVPALKGVGIGFAFICSFFVIYNVVVLAWGLFYLWHSFAKDLPWATCGNWWNTENCTTYQQATSLNLTNVTNSNPNATNGVLSAQEFWNNYVLRKSEGIDEIGDLGNWQMLLCFLVAWSLCFLCSFKGTKITGKIVYFTATFPYVILTVLVIRGCTLEGAGTGIRYYLYPNFTKLQDPTVWMQAGSQVLYSYGIGFTVLIAFGSYSNFNTDCFKYSIILTTACSMTSLFAGFSVFGVLGYLSHVTNKNISMVVNSGPGLVFQTYPTAISLMPLPQFWSVLFFFMIILVGVDTQFTCIEGVICVIGDLFPKVAKNDNYRKWTTLGHCTISAILGLPILTGAGIYFLNLLDNYSVNGIVLFTLVFFEVSGMAYIYGINRFYEDIRSMIGYYPHAYLKICYLLTTPIVLMALAIFSIWGYSPDIMPGYKYPDWATAIGWLTVAMGLSGPPLYFIYSFCKAPGNWKERLSIITTSQVLGRDVIVKYKNNREMGMEITPLKSGHA